MSLAGMSGGQDYVGGSDALRSKFCGYHHSYPSLPLKGRGNRRDD